MIDRQVRQRLTVRRKQLENEWQESDLRDYIATWLGDAELRGWEQLLAGTEWASEFVRFCAKHMATDPLTPFGFKFKNGDGNCSISVTDDDRNILTLHCIYQIERHIEKDQPEVVSIGEDRRALSLISGELNGRIFRCSKDGGRLLPIENFNLKAGEWRIFPAHAQLVFDSIQPPLIMCQLARRPRESGLIKIFDIHSGELVGHKWGSEEMSRTELQIELLGAMQYRPAAPILAELSRKGPAELRWHALRHCLALDSQKGLPILDDMRRGDDKHLRNLAERTWQQLCVAHPQLASLSEELAA